MASKTGHQLNKIFAFPGFWVLPINIDTVKLVLVNERPGTYSEESAVAFIRACIRESGLVSICPTNGQDEFEMAVTGFELCECPETTLGAIDGDVAVGVVVVEL